MLKYFMDRIENICFKKFSILTELFQHNDVLIVHSKITFPLQEM